MKRITLDARSNPKDGGSGKGKTFPSAKGITLALREGTLAAVKKRMPEDGISYVNDLVQVLILLWSDERVSKKLTAMEIISSEGPFKEVSNIRIQPKVLSAAHKAAQHAGFDGGVSELCRFLLEGYGKCRIELCLRKGPAKRG